MSMRIRAIGTAGSFPGPDSAASCYLLEIEQPHRLRIVLDLGSGALSALQRHVDLSALDAVILTHLHPDHCLDVTGLYVYRCYDPKYFCCRDQPDAPVRNRLPVYAPPGAQDRLQAAYHTDPGRSPVASSHTPTDLSETFDFRELGPDSQFQLGPVQVQTYLVDHPVEAYALRITHESGAVLCYSGDSDSCENLVAAATDADLFLCEAAFETGRDTARGIHLTGARAGEVAAAAQAKRLVLTHIPAWTNPATVRAEAADTYTGPIELARTGVALTVEPPA